MTSRASASVISRNNRRLLIPAFAIATSMSPCTAVMRPRAVPSAVQSRTSTATHSPAPPPAAGAFASRFTT